MAVVGLICACDGGVLVFVVFVVPIEISEAMVYRMTSIVAIFVSSC